MKVFKFGGASVSSIDRIRSTSELLSNYHGEKIVVVVSAMGKTTNALEKVVEAFYAGQKEEAIRLFSEIREYHLNIATTLLNDEAGISLADFFTEVEWLLHDRPVRDFDYYYDQVVCAGELLSSSIVAAYLRSTGRNVQWIDVRDLFRTDNNFRDAGLDWEFTAMRVNEVVIPLFESTDIVLTQGFIGSTDENESTTLGREGSDYSAAIFASLLNAESLTIWKDVDGVMNADPRLFPEAVILPTLDYEEVIEMAFYGAQVIHPKTIKPLRNKQIPLLVRSFLHPGLPGTVIQNARPISLPPIIVIKRSQVLLHLVSKDFSFVGEEPMARLYQLFGELRVKPNLVQTGAVSISICLDDKQEKIARLAHEAAEQFDVLVERSLELLTIRHHNSDILKTMTENRQIVLKQETPQTVQVLLK